MRKLIWLAMFFALLSLAACGGSSSSSGSSGGSQTPSLIGTWFHSSVENGLIRVTLSDDGTYKARHPGDTDPVAVASQGFTYCEEEGTWTSTDTQLTLVVVEENCLDTEPGEITIMDYVEGINESNEPTLEVTFEDGDGFVTFPFVKGFLAPPDMAWNDLEGYMMWDRSFISEPVTLFTFYYDGRVMVEYGGETCSASGTFVDLGNILQINVTSQDDLGCADGAENNLPGIGTIEMEMDFWAPHQMRICTDPDTPCESPVSFLSELGNT